MCRSRSAPRDNSAEIAARKEAERQARIQQGRSAIDSAFSQYNDDFYQDYQNQYLDYYTPQIEDQYSDAMRRLTLQLAQTGNLTGSVGAQQKADLQKYYDTQNQSITNRALEATNQLRSNIDSKKSDLYMNNRSAADPGSATSAATSAVSALQPAPPSSPLSNVFGDFFSNLGNVAAVSNARKYSEGTGVQQYGGSNRQSVKNIR